MKLLNYVKARILFFKKGYATAEVAIVFPVFFIFVTAIIIAFTVYAEKTVHFEETGEDFMVSIRKVDSVKRKTGIISEILQ